MGHEARPTRAVASRIPARDADLIERAAQARGESVSRLVRGMLAAPLAELRRTL